MSRRKCQNTKNRLKFKIWPPSPLEVSSFFWFYVHRGDLTLSQRMVMGAKSYENNQMGCTDVPEPGPRECGGSEGPTVPSSQIPPQCPSFAEFVISINTQHKCINSDLTDSHSLTCIQLDKCLKNLLCKRFQNLFLKLLTFLAEIPEDSIRLGWRLRGR